MASPHGLIISAKRKAHLQASPDQELSKQVEIFSSQSPTFEPPCGPRPIKLGNQRASLPGPSSKGPQQRRAGKATAIPGNVVAM